MFGHNKSSVKDKENVKEVLGFKEMKAISENSENDSAKHFEESKGPPQGFSSVTDDNYSFE